MNTPTYAVVLPSGEMSILSPEVVERYPTSIRLGYTPFTHLPIVNMDEFLAVPLDVVS